MKTRLVTTPTFDLCATQGAGHHCLLTALWLSVEPNNSYDLKMRIKEDRERRGGGGGAWRGHLAATTWLKRKIGAGLKRREIME